MCILTIILLSLQSTRIALSLSPSIPRLIGINHNTCKNNPLVGIGVFTYNSDGRTLNSTLWLVHCHTQERRLHQLGFDMLRYGMKIYVGGKWQDPAYDMYVQQKNNTWTENVIEYPPLRNYTNSSLEEEKPIGKGIFFENGNNSYIRLSLDLNTIGSPDVYKANLYTAYRNGHVIAYAPFRSLIPPLLNFTWPHPSWPDPLMLKLGDQSVSVPIKVTPTQLIKTYTNAFGEPIYLNLGPAVKNGVFLNFTPNSIKLPSSGSVNLTMRVTALHGAGISNVSLQVPGEYFSHEDKYIHGQISDPFNCTSHNASPSVTSRKCT